MTTIEKLRAEIKAANQAYWEKSQPIMSDPEYDKLVESLRKLSPNDPLLSEIGTEKLGDKKVKHAEHMFSIAKVYSYEDLIRWCKKVARSPDEKFLCSCKYDGLSVEYNNGKFITRGDGDVGNDITHMAQCIEIMQDVSGPGAVETFCFPATDLAKRTDSPRFVGELLVPNSRFGTLKQMHPELFGTYKTPRNLASGFANLKDPDSMCWAGAHLTVCTIVPHRTHEEVYTLTQLANKEVDIVKRLRDWGDMPCDGIVVRLADEEYGKTLGITQHHRNDYCALKFKEEEADVVIKEIAWQVGERHVTPVAIFDPVELDGVTITNATLHGISFIEEMGAYPGVTATLIRQGGVIPKIIRIDPQPTDKINKDVIPTACPVCGQTLVREGAYLSCVNESCKGKITARIVRGLSILGYKGIGTSLAVRVVTDFMIPDIMTWMTEMNDPALIAAKTYTKTITDKDGKEKTICEQAYTAHQIGLITRSVTSTLSKPVLPSTLLRAMCIEDVGTMFTTAVVNSYDGGIIGLMEQTAHDVERILRDTPGVRMDGLTKFMIWFEENKEKFLEFVKMFKLLPEKKPDYFKELTDRVAGMQTTYCFTGGGPKPRQELSLMALNKGARVTENANVCTVLVCADPNGNSSKLKKARAKGTRIISYEEYIKEVT